MEALITNEAKYFDNVFNSHMEYNGSFYQTPIGKNFEKDASSFFGWLNKLITHSEVRKVDNFIEIFGSGRGLTNIKRTRSVSTGVFGISATKISPVEICDSEAMDKFRQIHSEIDKYINKSVKIITEYFPDEKILIDIKQDPDSVSGFQELFLYIQTKRPLAELIPLFNVVDNEIFSDESIDSSIFNVSLSIVN